ncbi:hypothetical protein [Patiriisocius marinistellae]|nr:hypothetical protein [Patiriisocius marinistellae]
MATNTTNDEIDLGYLFEKINNTFKNIAIGIYNGIQFIIRNWYIVLGIIIAGVLLGLFKEKDSLPSKRAKIIIRTNFNTAEYTYNAINTLLEKSKARDTIFLQKNGFNYEVTDIADIEITPIINFEEISEKYDVNDRTLESVLRNVEFKEEEDVSESFFSDYTYHEVELSLGSYTSEATIKNIIIYLNNNEYIQKMGVTGKEMLERNIERNNFSISQIDSAISDYNEKVLLPMSTNFLAVVDKNFNYHNVVNSKLELQKINDKLIEDLIYADKAIIQIGENNIIEKKPPFLFKKYVIYPILFLFLFLFLSWLIKLYGRVKVLAAHSDK